MRDSDLTEYLTSLEREKWYRVDKVLGESSLETTQLVYYPALSGEGEIGPFVRKFISLEFQGGVAYEDLYAAERSGVRFRGIPEIVECYRTESQVVVVSRYVQGPTLASHVERQGPSAELAKCVFPRLCDAVIELHESLDAPIIHRDLKPSNVIVEEDSVKLIDLGIARSYKQGARRDTVHLGTRSYAPPEQFGFGQTDVRSDVYALGLLLGFMLTGRGFESGQLVGAAPQGIDVAAWKVIKRATSFDPKVRYVSVRELKKAYITAVKHRACASLFDFSEHLPFTPSLALGIAWDVALLLVTLFMLAICGVCAVYPDEAAAGFSLPVRFEEFFGLMGFPIALICFAIADKRMLRSVMPVMGKSTRGREALVCFGLAVLFIVDALLVLLRAACFS